MSIRRTRAVRRLDEALRALAALDAAAADPALLARHDPEVSRWSGAQHVAHLAEANVLCLRAAAALVAGDDERIVTGGSPNILGRLVLLLGRIPRGRGRAPEQTRPGDVPGSVGLVERLRSGRDILERLAADPGALAGARGRLPHPALGAFSATQWVRFTSIHVRHHLAIVADLA